MAGAAALTRSVLADQVKERLLDAILQGTYPPDSRIVETSVAKELGTSQAPVREALRGLEALGVVEITPFRGARVRRLDPEEILEAYVVRSAIESLGAKLAVPRMSDDDVKELASLGQEMQQAAAAGDGHEVALIDASFHGRIVEMSGNRTLARVWRSLEPFSRTYLTLVVPGADPLWSASLHDPIIDAISRRDSRGVVKALQQHFTEVSAVLGRRFAAADSDAERTPPAESTRLKPGKLGAARAGTAKPPGRSGRTG